MKKVVHIIPTLNFGGAEKFVVNLVNNSHSFQHEIIIFKDKKPFADLLADKVNLHLVKKGGEISLGLFKKIEEKLKELDADIVHTNLFGADFWGRIAASRLDIPVITTEHNLNKQESWVKSLIKKYLRGYSDLYTAPSVAVQKYMNHYYEIKDERIEIIPHGVELDDFLHTDPFMYHLPLRFLIIGRLNVQKGVDRAIEAFNEVESDEWILDIVGEGSEFKNIKRRIDNYDLQDKIRLWDATKDVVSEYDSHDIVVVPSRWEGFGLVALEAMASGRVVIASNVDGLSEFIESGETGFLVETENIVQNLKKQIEIVLENKEKNRQVAEKARQYAKNNYGIDKMVEEYEQLYAKLL